MGKHSTAEEEVIKKGPWTAEEDEVLINFVKKNGPRDWSSIRSMGLLPRTGKSCRLRWVNKLRPNLKKGCKFSAEEERLVLDLQARFGNKWATIASYLPGRTDNDVKNFWSTRQKRLARILKSSAQASRSKKNKGKAIVEEDEAPVLLSPESSFSQVKEEPSIQYHKSCSCFSFEPADTSKMVPPQLCLHPNIYTSMPQFETTQNVTHTSAPEPPLQCSFTELPPPEPDLPLLPESYNLCLELIEPSFMDVFPSQEVFEIGNVPELYPDLPFEDLEDCNDDLDHGGVNKDKQLASPIKDSFNDFPADMLDYLDAIPKSSAK